MYLIKLCMKLLVVSLTGHVIHVASLDDRRQCFGDGERNICYFHPHVSAVNWETAWKTCRELKSTLPVIPDQKVQAVFNKYLDDSLANFPVWTAGRYTGDSEWKWINGQPFQGTDKPPCPFRASVCQHETHAVLTQHRTYEADYPLTHSSYLCRFTGASCTSGSNDSIRWEDGCIEWDKNDRKTLNEARNRCLERGGDLAIFSGQDDLQRLQQLLPSHMFPNSSTKYWIGLHRKWWIWNATDVQDIRYNLLNMHLDDKRDCLFISNRYEWRQSNCATTIYAICQTVTYTTTATSTWSETRTQDHSTGIVIGAIVGLVIIIIVVALIIGFIIVRRRNRNQDTDERHRISQENRTQQVEFRRGAEETTDVYEELAPTAQDDQHGNYVNVSQASSLYTALRF